MISLYKWNSLNKNDVIYKINLLEVEIEKCVIENVRPGYFMQPNEKY